MQSSLLKSGALLILLFQVSLANALSCKNLLGNKVSIPAKHSTIALSEKSLNLMKELRLINESEFNHFKEDLLAGQSEIDSKIQHESFKEVLTKWETFLKKIDPEIEKFKTLTTKEQKNWKKKMRTLLFFNVGHFVTFLESSDLKVYKKSNTMLDSLNALPEGADLKVYMFEMEKEVMKYFSIDEFNKCKF